MQVDARCCVQFADLRHARMRVVVCHQRTQRLVCACSGSQSASQARANLWLLQQEQRDAYELARTCAKRSKRLINRVQQLRAYAEQRRLAGDEAALQTLRETEFKVQRILDKTINRAQNNYNLAVKLEQIIDHLRQDISDKGSLLQVPRNEEASLLTHLSTIISRDDASSCSESAFSDRDRLLPPAASPPQLPAPRSQAPTHVAQEAATPAPSGQARIDHMAVEADAAAWAAVVASPLAAALGGWQLEVDRPQPATGSASNAGMSTCVSDASPATEPAADRDGRAAFEVSFTPEASPPVWSVTCLDLGADPEWSDLAYTASNSDFDKCGPHLAALPFCSNNGIENTRSTQSRDSSERGTTTVQDGTTSSSKDSGAVTRGTPPGESALDGHVENVRDRERMTSHIDSLQDAVDETQSETTPDSTATDTSTNAVVIGPMSANVVKAAAEGLQMPLGPETCRQTDLFNAAELALLREAVQAATKAQSGANSTQALLDKAVDLLKGKVVPPSLSGGVVARRGP